MPVHLINELMPGGSRLFFTWPQNCSPLRLLWLILRLPALPTAYLPGLVTGETWIDWRWRGHRFSAHSIYGDFLFFSENPDCPETLLRTLAEYLAAQIPPDIPQIKSGG